MMVQVQVGIGKGLREEQGKFCEEFVKEAIWNGNLGFFF